MLPLFTYIDRSSFSQFPIHITRALTPWVMMMEGRASRRTIKVMSEAHLQKVLNWAGELGWNPGHRDAEPFQTADRDGFLSVSDHDNGDVVMAGGSFGSSGAPARKVVRNSHHRT